MSEREAPASPRPEREALRRILVLDGDWEQLIEPERQWWYGKIDAILASGLAASSRQSDANERVLREPPETMFASTGYHIDGGKVSRVEIETKPWSSRAEECFGPLWVRGDVHARQSWEAGRDRAADFLDTIPTAEFGYDLASRVRRLSPPEDSQ